MILLKSSTQLGTMRIGRGACELKLVGSFITTCAAGSILQRVLTTRAFLHNLLLYVAVDIMNTMMMYSKIITCAPLIRPFHKGTQLSSFQALHLVCVCSRVCPFLTLLRLSSKVQLQGLDQKEFRIPSKVGRLHCLPM